MAATDKPFNNQRTLDIVFAVSSILMLVSVIWMLYTDHYREYKDEQRAFREVEYALAQRSALEQIPDEKEFASAESAVKEALSERSAKKEELAAARAKMLGLQPQRERAEAKFQAAKAEVESKTSLLSIELE